ncbi:cathepsin D [Malassezia cuniculi]|uniref:Cathepsin D n=1 Tax=Malassezia cuniculi TaxID=948313 RepID=A0AAF0EW40_9BASI|nr:cathepsin D [Malassezia cuniculi]
MQFFTKALVAAALTFASVEAAAPQDGSMVVPLKRRNLFLSIGDELNLKAVVAHLNNVQRKYQSSMDNYKRRTGEINPFVKALLDLIKRDGSTSSIGLDVVGDGQLWTGPVTFGGQEFHLDFDTGSADVIVNREAYNPEKSSSSKNTKTTFSTAYADGTTARGFVYTDDFKVGNLEAKNVAIGRSHTTFIRDEGKSEGIAGLSFSSISTFQDESYKPFFDSLIEQGAVAEQKFQFTLNKGDGSELFFGGIDNSKVNGNIAWSNVDSSKGFWAAAMKINGMDITGIVDSGSTIITGPTFQVRSLFNRIGGIQSFTQGSSLFGAFDCGNPPQVTFEFGGQQFELDKEVTSFGRANGKCVLSISGMDNIPMNAWIVGDTFFLGRTVIFDAEQKRVGVANRA